MTREAILLLGPTGAGKTPLGDALEAAGLRGRRCVHFDFGRNLRRACEAGGAFGLNGEDAAHVRQLLRDGLLLEDERFNIAIGILAGFLAERAVQPADLLIMNGLPRHAGQARDLAPFLDVRRVVHLRATPEVVFERIRLNSGGDRTGRADDSPGEIAGKVRLFEKRTLPLLDHYRAVGVIVTGVTIEVHTTAQDVVRELEVMGPKP